MNRVVVSIPRVLDSALVVTQDAQIQIPTGTLPATATAPYQVTDIKAVCNETQMSNIVITPLNDQTNCSRVTATVTIPLTLSITDANNQQFTTHSSVVKNINVILYIPNAAAFPYNLTSEGAFGYDSASATQETTTVTCATCKILVRLTAIEDLLIPSYGYAPINHADMHHNHSNSQNFLNQPLFPTGKIY